MTRRSCTEGRYAPARVLFAIPSMEVGGSERVILNLIRHLDPNRFEPHLAFLQEGELLKDVPLHVKIHKLGVRRARFAIFALAKLCWHLKPKAILSTSAHLNSAIVTGRPLLPRHTKVLTREGTDITSRTRSRVRLLIYKQMYRQADLVICLSDHMKEDLVREFGLARSKTIRIYNPVDIESIAAMAEREPNPFSNSCPNLVGVGRLSREKGFDLLLRSIPLVKRQFPSTMLTLVGDGPDFAMLKGLQRELDLDRCVQFLGRRWNPYPFIKYADVLVLPSRFEGLPNVVLEAIALGTTVVATNCTGALSEIASCSGRMQLVNGRTPEALASGIISAIAEMTARPKSGPEPQFEARFGLRAALREYENVFAQCIEPLAEAC